MFAFLKKLFGSGNKEQILDLLRQRAIILDVRTVGEFKQGHVKGSVNVPLDQLRGQLNRLKKQQKPIVACCATGRRSGMAAGMLREAGITAVNGGGWQSVRNLIRELAPSTTNG